MGTDETRMRERGEVGVQALACAGGEHAKA